MEITVIVDLAPRVQEVAEKIAGQLTRIADMVQGAELPKAEKEETQKPEATQEKTQEAAQTKEAQSVNQKKAPTLADVRAAMEATRKRLAGEDESSEEYQKAKKQLNKMFLQMAQVIGYNKPSELPEDVRQRFIEELNLLRRGSDGAFFIENDLPF